ncbi:hypothetical protein CcaverHIS002_0211830 [Cutaneotrichosporon cavernicola]|nr:hypothetical protein CcaverHIS002_0211830 [Cutaneotrichosporon cavernicola]
MAIADLSTPPRSTSPQKRSSPGGGSPGKRLAIDVLAWRSGKSGAALFDFGLDDAGDERCCSPTEIDTPPPSEGEMAHAKAKTLTFGGIKASHTIRPAKSGLQAEETLRPGGLALRETETVVPGTLGLQPAWEATLGPTSSMRPLKKCSTNSNGNDTGFKCLSRSRQQPGDTSHRSLEPRSQSLATASTAIDSTTMASIQRLDNCKRELGFEDYLAVLVEMKVRVVLVSSAEMDRAVEGIRAAHS